MREDEEEEGGEEKVDWEIVRECSRHLSMMRGK